MFETKNALFGSFWARMFKKNFIIFEINPLKFVRHESLTRTTIFGIGYAFSKGLGSTFSESPGPGMGRLYTACRV